jgi:hypothetical protein
MAGSESHGVRKSFALDKVFRKRSFQMFVFFGFRNIEQAYFDQAIND